MSSLRGDTVLEFAERVRSITGVAMTGEDLLLNLLLLTELEGYVFRVVMMLLFLSFSLLYNGLDVLLLIVLREMRFKVLKILIFSPVEGFLIHMIDLLESNSLSIIF